MEMIESLIGYLYLVIAELLILLLIGVVFFFRKYTQRKNHPGTSATESETPHLDYSSFNRKDTVEFVKFDDIIDFRWGGAIVTDNGTRFVAGLQINGYDYDMASAEERFQSMSGMIRMTNVISGPLTVHQDAREVDLTENIHKCEECIHRLQKKIDALQTNYHELKATIDDLSTGESEALEHYLRQLEQNIREQDAIAHMVSEQEAIMQELINTSGSHVSPTRRVFYLVDWMYDPANFASRALDKSGIYKEARRRLYDKLNILANALSKCGVKAKRMSCEELLEAQYHHFHPYSSSKFRLEDVFGSSYFHLFTTLDDSEMHENIVREQEEIQRMSVEDEKIPYELQLMEQEKARETELIRKYSDAIDAESENEEVEETEEGTEEEDDDGDD